MILGESTWQEVRDFDKEAVCVFPTGSLEQHGPHLPLLTDTLLSTKVCSLAEKETKLISVLYPGIWLGCSAHHMAMSGSATATVSTYVSVLSETIESAIHHGFRKFLVVNGHGGNTEANGVALRELKHYQPNLSFAHADYYGLIGPHGENVLTGPLKSIRHACEAEASMMLFLYPDLVKSEKLRDDGLKSVPPTPIGLKTIHSFDEITDEGSFGYATYASAEKGKQLIDLAVKGVVGAIQYLYNGYYFAGDEK